MSKKHTVKTHSWVGGILHTVENFFDSIEEAIEHTVAQAAKHGNSSDSHSIKIYNDQGELVQHVNSLPSTTYA
jgi:hypothetical protein